MVVSSANERIISLQEKHMSFTQIKYKRGPRIEPCVRQFQHTVHDPSNIF